MQKLNKGQKIKFVVPVGFRIGHFSTEIEYTVEKQTAKTLLLSDDKGNLKTATGSYLKYIQIADKKPIATSNTWEIQELENLQCFVIQENQTGAITDAPAIEINRILNKVCQKLNI